MNYSFKHNFQYPFPAPSTGPFPTAAAGTVPPTGTMFSPYTYHHHYGPYGRRFARFGLFRRFFWFGLGAGVASWWIRSKERRLSYDAQAQAADAAVGSGQTTAHNGQYGRKGGAWGWGGHEWRATPRQAHDTAPPRTQAAAPIAPAIIPSTIPFPPPSATASLSSTVPAVQQEAPTAVPTEEKPSEGRFGRWSSRRARRAEAEHQALIATATQSTPPTAFNPSAAPTQGPDDLAVIRETIERVLAEKKRDVAAAQAKAKVEAREYARDKLDRLSVILEGLRENLQNDQATEEKKLV